MFISQQARSIRQDLVPEDGARLMIGTAYIVAQMKFSGRSEAEVGRFSQNLLRALFGPA